MFLLKSDVKGYQQTRDGKTIFVKPHSTRRVKKDPLTGDLFRKPAPPATLKLTEDQARHPEKYTPDLFTGQTAAAPESAKVPARALANVKAALSNLQHLSATMHAIRRASGPVHEAGFFRDRGPHIVGSLNVIHKFRGVAKDNGVDAEKVLAELGGMPDLSPSHDATEHHARNAPRQRLHGVTVAVEHPAGTTRIKARAGGGEPWLMPMVHHYGEIPGTVGADGDAVDAYVGPHPESKRIFIANQRKENGDFDEHKVLFGFRSPEDASAGYHSHYPDWWDRLTGLHEVKPEHLHHWIKHGDKSVPYAPPPAWQRNAIEREAHIEQTRQGLAEDEASGDEAGASFHRMVLEHATRQHERLNDAVAHVRKHGPGATLRSKDRDAWAMFLPDASAPGKHRFQLFDRNGFFSHSTHATPEEAAEEAASQGYIHPDNDAPDRVMGTRQFERGNKVAGLIQALNSKLISQADADREFEAINAEYGPMQKSATIVFLKAKRAGDDRTGDMFGNHAPTHVETRTRKDGVVQGYHTRAQDDVRATVSTGLTPESARDVRIQRKIAAAPNPVERAHAQGFYDHMLGRPSQEKTHSVMLQVPYAKGMARGQKTRERLGGKPWYETEKERDGSKWKWIIYREGIPMLSGEASSEKKADQDIEFHQINLKDKHGDWSAPAPAAPKPATEMTEAEFGESQRGAHISELELQLAEAKGGRMTFGPYSPYPSKAAALKGLKEAIEHAKTAAPERFASDHLAKINQHLRLTPGAKVAPHNQQRYEIDEDGRATPKPRKGMSLDEARAHLDRANRERPLGLTWSQIQAKQGGKIR